MLAEYFFFFMLFYPLFKEILVLMKIFLEIIVNYLTLIVYSDIFYIKPSKLV